MNEVKSKIKSLVDKYELLDQTHIKKYTEEETKKDFILPLFEALGWNVTDKNEVTAEESQSSGRVDYGFYLGGRIKFYLEAKPIKADLQNEDYAKQAIRYSWNKGVDWAILTDFEGLKVFYCQDPTQSLFSKLVFEIRFNEYIDRFDQLWLLSKDSFKASELDLYAQQHGKKFQKISVGEQLYKHLNECRQILIEKLGTWNGIKDRNLLDEGVQKLLDRLIFIRVAEDRGIEDSTLIPLVRAWEGNKNGKSIYESMIGKFRELDEIYNSNLFTKHPFEKWNESPGVTEKVIEILQGKTGYYEYDFKAMSADVLGAVYENYLGHRLAASKKGIILDKDARKRKEQGIYYTPAFIVDYIVRNTLKPILDKCKSINDLQKIKVLDPACGSGSFLIKALEVINEKYKEFGNPANEFTKIMILEQNIYGVDLDEQAVEIARLNLLLSALETRMKLPRLDKNIKNGNSLISGSDEELEKYFGKNFRDKKPFNWEEEFPEVFQQGGFDVIIGNPPYIKEDNNKKVFEDLKSNPYYQGKMDIWTMFASISIDLLKNNGILGFISPSNWVSNYGASNFRNKILKDGQIVDYIDFGDYKVFQDASIQTMILIFEKKIPDAVYFTNYLKVKDGNLSLDEIKELMNSQLAKEKVEMNINKLRNANITFNQGNLESVLSKIEARSNFKFDSNNIGNGIDVLQDFLNKDHLIKLGLGADKKGEGVFILSDKEITNLDLNENEQQILKPYYNSENINRYISSENASKYKIIYADKNFRENIDKYPNLKKHLDQFKPILTSVFAPYGLHRSREERFFTGVGLFGLRKTLRPAFSYVDFPCYVTRAFLIIKSKDVDLKYLLGILNSNLSFFWFKNKGKTQGGQLQIDKEPLSKFPVYLTDNLEIKNKLINLVEIMLELNATLRQLEVNSNRWNEIKSEIEKTDKKIDEEVYKLYGLTSKEIQIVENNKE